MDRDLVKGILKKANEDARPYGVSWHLLANGEKHTVFFVMNDDVLLYDETKLYDIKTIMVVDHTDALNVVIKNMESTSRAFSK